MSDNLIPDFPDDFELLTDLKDLNVSGNRIDLIPIRLYLNRGLQRLDLSRNDLPILPHSVGDLELLKVTKEWEVGIGFVTGLTDLNLSRNRLDKFPPTLDLCNDLKNLDLLHAETKFLFQLDLNF